MSNIKWIVNLLIKFIIFNGCITKLKILIVSSSVKTSPVDENCQRSLIQIFTWNVFFPIVNGKCWDSNRQQTFYSIYSIKLTSLIITGIVKLKLKKLGLSKAAISL